MYAKMIDGGSFGTKVYKNPNNAKPSEAKERKNPKENGVCVYFSAAIVSISG